MTSHTKLSLVGKFFIIPPDAATATMHGKILGVLDDAGVVFLCQLQPVGGAEVFALPQETVLTLEQLIGSYLFDDETIWQANWARVEAELKAAKAAQAEARQRHHAVLIEAVKAGKVRVVGVDPAQEGGDETVVAIDDAGVDAGIVEIGIGGTEND